MEKKRGSLMTVIVGVILGAVIITGLAIDVFSVISTLNTNKEQTEAYRSRLMEDQQAELKNQVETAMSLINQVYAKQQAGEYTEEEAKKRFADREIRVFSDDSGEEITPYDPAYKTDTIWRFVCIGAFLAGIAFAAWLGWLSAI